MRKALFALFLLMHLLLLGSQATAHAAIEDLSEEELPELEDVVWMLMHEPPEGVVFHVLEQDEDALLWVLPRIRLYTEVIRKRWPDFPVAIVTHGAEMLILTVHSITSDIGDEVHTMSASLVNDLDVVIQVCGTYASTFGFSEEDFPNYVEVVPYAPAQISDYRDLGYNTIDVELTW